MGKEEVVKKDVKLTKLQEDKMQRCLTILKETGKMVGPDVDIAVFVSDSDGRMSYNMSTGSYHFKTRLKAELEVLQVEQIYNSLRDRDVEKIKADAVKQMIKKGS